MSIMSMLVAGGGSAAAFSPASLFAAGEQGVWYDPSDLTTMFTDSAGTTPVGTPGNGSEQPVGLLLDKSQSGVGTNGAARYNLLTYTEQFDNAAWTKTNASISVNSTTDPLGGNTADKVVENTSSSLHYVRQVSSVSSGTKYTLSIYVKPAGRNWIALTWNNGPGYYFDCQNGVIGSSFTGTGTVSNPTIAAAGNGWYRCTIDITSGGIGGGLDVFLANADNSASYIGDGTSGAYVWGADCRLSSQSALTPTYQKITSDWAATMAGNHATQSTSTARPTLSAKYNLFLYSEQFDNSYWYQTGGATLTANQAIAPDGTNTAELMTITGANVFVFNNGSQPSTTANVIYKMTSYFKQGTARYAYPVIAATGSVRYGSLVDLQTGVLVTEKTIGTPSNTSCTITDAGNGWWRITQTCSASSSGSGYGIFACTNNSAITVDGNNNILNATIGSTAYIWGADFRVSNDSVGLPAYQRVVDANTYDSTGFPYYLNADGVDDYLRVSSLNMTSTNKVGVFTAIRVLIDTDTQLIHDFNNGNPGQFVCYYKNPTLGSTLFYGGTAQSNLNSNSAWSIPAGKVLTFTGDISAPLGVIRENGTQVASSAGSVGTGNFGNGILDIFARGATTNLKGRIYGHIFRGAASTATEISNTENWLNGKGKIY